MPIAKLLIANRGEIACRIARTCQAMGIATVAVYAEADAGAPHVLEATEAVPLGDGPPADTYLRADLLVDAGRRTGADALHPGYGFLSESAELARRCLAAGLTWVGPPPEAIEAMGSKLAARSLMAGEGVAVLAGCDLSGLDEAAAEAAAAAVGWPVLVKSSAGGGGRGMRMVRGPGELADAVAAARREAEVAFGDPTVFCEQFVERSRHVEVQVLADRQGGVAHLFERECSIQRRYQKIIEEAPSPAVGESLRQALGDAAIRAARAVGYVGAGTVEFLVAPDGSFAFLEMNTRLQVEHPVTEMVTGLDLVRLQLLVATGAPLPPEVLDAELRGHAVEARLYAEDPDDGYRPSPGALVRLALPELPGVRVDAGYREGSVVSAHYDPLLAKVIAHGATRDEATRKLAGALRQAQVFGVATNRELLIGILEHPGFAAGDLDTGFLERHPPATLSSGRPPEGELASLAVAAALARAAEARRSAPVLVSVSSGWRNNPSAGQRRAFAGPTGQLVVEYRLHPRPRVEVDGTPRDDIVPRVISPDRVELVVGGVLRRYTIVLGDQVVHVHGPRGAVSLPEVPRLPVPGAALEQGSLVAPMPGTVVRVQVAAGDRVRPGQVLAALEAMKMEHQVTAPEGGVVRDVCVQVGQAVDAGTVLVVLEPDGDDGEVDA